MSVIILMVSWCCTCASGLCLLQRCHVFGTSYQHHCSSVAGSTGWPYLGSSSHQGVLLKCFNVFLSVLSSCSTEELFWLFYSFPLGDSQWHFTAHLASLLGRYVGPSRFFHWEHSLTSTSSSIYPVLSAFMLPIQALTSKLFSVISYFIPRPVLTVSAEVIGIPILTYFVALQPWRAQAAVNTVS
jgi:hypothetical protein